MSHSMRQLPLSLLLTTAMALSAGAAEPIPDSTGEQPTPPADVKPPPAGTQSPTAINVYPPDINLTTARDRQAVIVQAVYESGITRDVTDEAKLSVANAELTRLEKNTLYPTADGSTELKIEFAGHTKTLAVTVQDAAANPPISFQLDVMPVFMRAGCNTGSCHGAARGKDGFMLVAIRLRSERRPLSHHP